MWPRFVVQATYTHMNPIIRPFILALAFAACSNDAGPANHPIDFAGLDLYGVDLYGINGSTDMAVSSTGCGTCPSGYTCGSVNSIPVCRSAAGIPLFSSVFMIVMENTSKSTLDAATNTPFMAGLKGSAATASNYHGVAHPSLPNYIALISGGTQSIGCDCDPTGSACSGLSCNALVHSCGCPQTAMHLGQQLDGVSKTWRAYVEDLGSDCNVTSSGNYAVRHVPFLYFDDVRTNAARCADRVAPYSALATDLAGTTRAFNFIAPNLVDDMHDPFPAGDTNLANGDAWLSAVIPAITASASYKKGGIIFIVWDEDDLSGVLAKDDPIPLFVISPLAKQGNNTVVATHLDHASLLATVEDGLGVGRLGSAVGAAPLSEFFPAH